MRISHALTAATVGLSLLALTACSGSDEAETSPSPVAPVASDSPEPTPEPTPEPSDAPEPATSGDYTAPGAEYSTSEDLYFPMEESWWNPETEESEFQEIGATYSFGSVREGAASDLSGELGEDDIAKLDGYSIWYVDYTVTLDGGPLSEPSHGITRATDFEIYDTAGAPSAINFIFFGGGPDVCAGASLTDLAKEGTTEACQIVAATGGESIAHLEFHGDKYAGNESPYDGSPAVWVIE